jgi:hypothetical protein
MVLFGCQDRFWDGMVAEDHDQGTLNALPADEC